MVTTGLHHEWCNHSEEEHTTSPKASVDTDWTHSDDGPTVVVVFPTEMVRESDLPNSCAVVSNRVCYAPVDHLDDPHHKDSSMATDSFEGWDVPPEWEGNSPPADSKTGIYRAAKAVNSESTSCHTDG